VDFSKMKEHSEGIIATSSCLQGLIPQIALGHGEFAGMSRSEVLKKICSVTETYIDIFGDDFYLEAHNHGIEDEETMREIVDWLSDRYDLDVITANDCHYSREGDYWSQKVQTTLTMNRWRDDPIYFDSELADKYPHESLHVKSAQEMVDLMPEFPDAPQNTMKILSECDARLPMEEGEYFFPEFPDLAPAETAHQRLKKECGKGFRTRYPNPTDEHRERMRYELGIIDDMGFSNYFLIVADMVQYAKQAGILVGPGRGSAAGSMVTYCLGITNLDPLKHDLLFSRFLNPARVTMPDIDIDFDDARRDEVFDYLYRKYGEDRVAKTITFSKYKTKGAMRDVGKIFHMEQSEVDQMAKQVPDDVSTDPIDEVLEESPELRQLERNDDRVEKTFEALRNIYGMESHTGKHAAAAVVTPDQLTDHLPTQRDDDEIITQFDGDQLEELGLLKIDVLGLKTLRTIRVANDIVEERTGQRIPQETLESRDDPEVYDKVFATGDTLGIFQFQSGGMRKFLADMSPEEFNHITAMVALYRPGPMELIPDFIKRMHGDQEVKYLDESVHEQVKDEVADILDDTYGIMVFQEQIMQVCQRLAGFSLGEADIMRRAVGKKKRKLLEKQEDKFVQGCKTEGYSEDLGESIFELIEKFADYGFNRCLTGDTTLMGNEETVAEMCEQVSMGENHDTTAYSMNEEGEIVENEVLTVAPQGEREVYEVTLEGTQNMTGQGPHRTIRATGNHKFPIGRMISEEFPGIEEKRLDEFKEGEIMYVYVPDVEEGYVRRTQIESIEHVGTEEVYDVTMAEEPHNFVTGEGIVTCNSHAAAYAAIAYQQAYFKAHHPTAFFTAAMRTEDNEDDQVDLIQDAESHGVDLLPPSVNESGQQFTAIPGKKEIRFGLGTIKHVGQEAQKIIDEREKNGPYQSLMDLALRAIPNLGAVKSLIKAGAMDDFGLSRKAMYEQKDEIFSYARKMRDYRTGDRVTEPEAPEVVDKPEWPAKMRFQQERDVAGIYTTGQPIDRFPGLVEAFDDQTYRRTRRGKQDKDYMLRCGSILSIDEATTSTDKPMWWIRYMTQNGIYEEPTFEWRFKHIKDKLEKDVPLAIVGEADATGEWAGSPVLMNVMPMRRLVSRWAQVLRITADSKQDAKEAVQYFGGLPSGDTEVWATVPAGTTVCMDKTVQLDLEAYEDAHSFGEVTIY
jgi:DNA polymerase III alpha subunit